MELVRKLYLRVYLLVMMLYVFLNKGVAYTYLVEFLWISGIAMLVLNRKKYYIIWRKETKLLLFFIGLSALYIIKGIPNYSFIDLVRDSFIFQYGWFAFIILLYSNEVSLIWDELFKIYKWFPLVALVNFILQYYVPFFETIRPFGGIPILLFKNGDMGVHLLISTLLMLLNLSKLSWKWQLGLLVLIIFDFLTLSAYSRSGMLAYLIGLIAYLFFAKGKVVTANNSLKKYIPWALLIVIPLYLSIQVGENFQGRAVGVGQLKENITSMASTADDVTLEKNVIWRILWWTNILDYSFTKQYFFTGKGLGMSLAQTDDVITGDEELRSPHNFHLNIMARFGVIIFALWLYWLYLLFKPLFKRKLKTNAVAISCILLAFIINASFDVFLEGPMGAFPFWTWVGLFFITEDSPV